MTGKNYSSYVQRALTNQQEKYELPSLKNWQKVETGKSQKKTKKRTLDIYMVEGLEWGINLSGTKRNINNNEIFSTKQTENIFITEVSRVDKGLGKRVLICYWFSSILIKNF